MTLIDELFTQDLPIEIFSTAQIRAFEQAAMNDFHLEAIELMRRAGLAAFEYIEDRYDAQDMIVVCGPGNNGGDGYYVAKLAMQAGIEVTVFYLAPTDKLTGAAKWAFEEAQKVGVSIEPFDAQALDEVDLIVDALFGIGLARPIEGGFLDAVNAMNDAYPPIVAIDIPSGINSDAGAVLGNAVRADSTITFIGLKSGLMTGAAKDYVGNIYCDDLDLPEELFIHQSPYAVRLNYDMLGDYFSPRARNSHKGDFGHVVIIGGDYGMAGAVTMAATAALRVGAGLVTVVTREAHVPAIIGSRPEVMAIASEQVNLDELLARATVIVLGPGLGRSEWSGSLYLAAMKANKPLVIDADGLYFLKKNPLEIPMILTPHPGEAAQLLDCTTEEVQDNRYQALQKLKQRYPNAHIVLKGAGSLILEDDGVFSVCPYGNPGMSSAGMGDILTGTIAGLLAQGQEMYLALELGVIVHAMAGDRIAMISGERGLIATDLLPAIQSLVNPAQDDDDDDDDDLLEDLIDEDFSDFE